MGFELGEELLTADTSDEFPLDGWEVVKRGRVEEILVAAGGCDFIQLLQVCVRHTNSQDTDPCSEPFKTRVNTEAVGRRTAASAPTQSACDPGGRQHVVLSSTVCYQNQDMGHVLSHPQRLVEQLLENVADALS